MKQATVSTAIEYEDWKAVYHAGLGKRVQRALAEHAASGKPTGCAPVGYKNVNVNGEKRISPDENMAPLVREAFELAATGNYSLRKLLAIIAMQGLRSRNGNVMGVSALQNVLTNPIYCGFNRHTDQMTKNQVLRYCI